MKYIIAKLLSRLNTSLLNWPMIILLTFFVDIVLISPIYLFDLSAITDKIYSGAGNLIRFLLSVWLFTLLNIAVSYVLALIIKINLNHWVLDIIEPWLDDVESKKNK